MYLSNAYATGRAPARGSVNVLPNQIKVGRAYIMGCPRIALEGAE